MSRIGITLAVDDKGSPVIKQFTDKTVDRVKQMSDRSSRQVERMSAKFTQGLGGAISKVGRMMTNLKTLAAGALVGWGVKRLIGEFIQLSNVQEKAETKLAAVLKATGEASGYNIEQLKGMASAMQEVTTVGDEVILNGMAIMSTFKQIKGDNFRDATAAAMDMAHVMDTDLKSAVVMVGKAMNDPVANLSAMTRAGVQFTEQQKDMIKQMWAAGDAAGAQSIILRELESQFGGAAAAARNTFSGAVMAAGNALGDLKEKIGAIITQNPYFISLAKQAEQLFIDLTNRVDANKEALMEYAANAGRKVIDFFKDVVAFGRKTIDFWVENRETIKTSAVELAKFYATAKIVAGFTAIVTFFQGMTAATAALAAKTIILNNALKTSLPVLAAYAAFKTGEWLHGKFSGLSQIEKDIEEGRARNERLKARLDAAMAEDTQTYPMPERTTPDLSPAAPPPSAADLAKTQISAMIQVAQADKKLLSDRLSEYEKFYTELGDKIKKNAELEKQHIRELTALHEQKMSVQKSAEEMVLKLRQSQMSTPERYESQKQNLDVQYFEALRMSGQERVKALEDYKRDVMAFANTYSSGVEETSRRFGESTTRVIADSQQIVREAIQNINWATAEQQSALDSLAMEKQRQIDADQAWGDALTTTATEVEDTIQSLQDTIAGLSRQIEEASRVIDVSANDHATSVVRQIQQELDRLHDKTIYITAVRRTVDVGQAGRSGAGPANAENAGFGSSNGTAGDDLFDTPARGLLPTPEIKGSYRYGTEHVPATGLYRLHQGEKVTRPGKETQKPAQFGDIIIHVPESAAPQRAEDWREITRNFIKPELERMR